MTTSLIHLKIVEKDNFDFDKSLFTWAKTKSTTLDCFDFDNHSGKEMYGYAQQLLAQSNNVVLLVTINASQNVTSPLAWIESMLKKNNHLYLVGIENQFRYLGILAKKYPDRCVVVENMVEAKIKIAERLALTK